VAASFQTPVLFQIAENLREMELNLAIDESDVGQVREGLATSFTVDAFPNREFKGRVKQIRLAAVTTQNVVTYPVVVAVDNADLTLLPGMTANAEIEVGGSADALRVPNAALRFRPPEGTPGAAGRARPGRTRRRAARLLRAQAAARAHGRAGAEVRRGRRGLRQRMQARRAAREGQGEGAADAAPAPGGGGREGRGDGARGGYQDALKTALAPLRESLSEAQRATLDQELGGMGGAPARDALDPGARAPQGGRGARGRVGRRAHRIPGRRAQAGRRGGHRPHAPREAERGRAHRDRVARQGLRAWAARPRCRRCAACRSPSRAATSSPSWALGLRQDHADEPDRLPGQAELRPLPTWTASTWRRWT
jgi:hypothetical protein